MNNQQQREGELNANENLAFLLFVEPHCTAGEADSGMWSCFTCFVVLLLYTAGEDSLET